MARRRRLPVLSHTQQRTYLVNDLHRCPVCRTPGATPLEPGQMFSWRFRCVREGCRSVWLVWGPAEVTLREGPVSGKLRERLEVGR